MRMLGPQISGFGIVRKPSPLLASFDLYMTTHPANDLYQLLCKLLSTLPRAGYRGISREPLKALPSENPHMLQVLERAGCDVHSNYAACLRFMRIMGDDNPESDFDEDLLPTYSSAYEVFSL